MPQSRAKFLIPAVGTAVVAGGVATYFYLNGAFGDSSSPLASAKLVPDTAVMATSVSADNWSKLQQFGTPEAQNVIGKSLQDLNQKFIAQSNIDYEKDLKPWVGNVMIATLPSSSIKSPQTTQLGQGQNLLTIVGIKNKISALNFANKLKAEKGVTIQESDYNGEKISQVTQSGATSYSAILSDHLVLASNITAVQQAIDTFKGKPSFASKSGVDDMIAKGVEVQNPLAQIYIPDSTSAVQQLTATNPTASQLPPQTLASLKSVKSLAAGIGVDDVGIRVRVVAHLDPQLIKTQYQPTAGTVASQLPGDTIALVSGQGISRGWAQVVEQTKTNPALKQAIDSVRQRFQFVNIDLDRDIFSWMDGEFASAIIPLNQGPLASIGFSGGFIFHTSNRQTAEATLSKLDQLAQFYSFSVNQTNIQGKTITQWQTPAQGVLIGHGWLDQSSVFIAVGDQVINAIAAPKNPALDNSETFKAVTGSLPKPNGGYFYIDMDKAVSLVTNNILRPQNITVPADASAVLNSIRGIGATASSPESSTSEADLLIALKPKK